MDIKNIWSKIVSWFDSLKLFRAEDYQPQLDEEGLISEDAKPAASAAAEQQPEQGNEVVVKKVQPADRQESLEKMQNGFNKLVVQLESINEHLGRQVAQHEEMMNRMEKLPKLIESFPTVVENQKQLAEQLFDQLKGSTVKEEQFIEAVEKIPFEIGKQTDALVDIDHQLAAAADTDVQMSETFNKFTETLGKLNHNTVSQTDSILQMSKTFATSDRYLKYLMTKQNKRFIWIFLTAIGVCVLVILILAGIILYLKR